MVIEKEIRTGKKEAMIEITSIINEELLNHKISEGQVLVFVPHTTAGITINENADPDVCSDIIKGLNSLDFEKVRFDHAEGNSPAHLKTLLTGNSVQIIVKNSKLLLGIWQGIYFCEYDGPRNRKFLIQFLEMKK